VVPALAHSPAGAHPPRVCARQQQQRQQILDWYGMRARPLGWRRTKDPYAILVSEVMLQQTQVARVEPAWRAFLQLFPTVRELASAPLADVVTAWRGLGYNRRAVSLHRCADAIVQRHGGAVPDDLAALRALPGIGDYTARAVLAFAFGRPAAPVDTNVARVLTRLVAGRPLGKSEAQRMADELVPVGDPGTWSHALMDLGAQVCTTRSPKCGECPVAGACIWQGQGPDPAAAGAYRARPQGKFAGSDRYHRGRLVDALRAGPVPRATLTRAVGSPDADRIAGLLVSEGLAEWKGDMLQLPRSSSPMEARSFPTRRGSGV
jgi:A/G-specific adenine glycosylase